MTALTNRFTRTKRNRSTSEKSLDDDGEAEYFVLGGERLGASIARRLRAEGHSVSRIDETHDSAEAPGLHGNPGDPRVLEDAGVSETSTVVVATPRDSRNLLIAQLVRAHFGVSEVLVLVNDPDRYDIVAETGHEPACATTALSEAVVDGLEKMNTDRSHTA